MKLLLRGACGLLGPGLEVVTGAEVLIEGGTIVAAGHDVGDRNATVIETDGLIIPGFIDCHVHIGFVDPIDVLRGGVTTARDLGWPPADIFPLAQRSRDPGFAGPLVLAAGPMLTVPGGYPTRAAWAPPGTGLPLDSPEAAVGAVADVVDAGATIVKVALNPPVGPVLDGSILTPLVTEAHARGVRVTGHIHGLDQLHLALDAGVDEMAHMLMSDEPIPDATLARMAGAGMTVVSTLGIRHGDGYAGAIANTRRAVAAGVTILYGTDLGNEGPRPGIDAAEITALAEAGLDTRSIVAAATTEAAAWLGMPGKGCLEAGADADVVVVAPDALTRPQGLCDIRTVIRGGRRVV